MINAKHLREFIIRPTLKDAGLWSQGAENLLMGTAAVESNMGTYLRQLNAGPALGVYQMEPATHDSLWDHYLRYRRPLREYAESISPNKGGRHEQLVYDLRYATFMTRIKYLGDRNPIPGGDEFEELAAYWKRVYNTHLGAGTVEDFLIKYKNTV